jgi:hypothetical protein
MRRVTEQLPRDFTTTADAGSRFRKTLVRVMAVQVVTLILLWLLQQHYTA